MKKAIFPIAVLCILAAIVNIIPVSIANAEDNMNYIKGTIFVNGLEVKTENTILIGSDFEKKRTINDNLVKTDKIVEYMLFPLQTVLEALGADVSTEESTGNIYFNFENESYICKLKEIKWRDFPTLYFIRICKIENKDSTNDADYIQLNPMSGDGSYCMINNNVYLSQQTGQRLLKALGCKVDIDLEKRILNMYPSYGISITLNGSPIQFDIAPIIENGRTLVPLRAIFEALGATVEWSNSTQTITAKKDDINISLQIGSNELKKNGESIALDVSARIIDGHTFVPLRAINESFGAVVKWDNATKTVIILKTTEN